MNQKGTSSLVRTTYPELGRVLAEARNGLRLSRQADLARLFGTTSQTVSRWEAGTRRPRPDQLARLATVLGLSPDLLLTLSGYTQPDAATQPTLPYPTEGLTALEFEELVAAVVEAKYPEGELLPRSCREDADDRMSLAFRHPRFGLIAIECKLRRHFGPCDFERVRTLPVAAVDVRVLAISREASPALASAVSAAGWELWDRGWICAAIGELPDAKRSRIVAEFFPPGK